MIYIKIINSKIWKEEEENNELNIQEIQLIKLKDLNLSQERAYWKNYILKYFIYFLNNF